jgi:hypothetical protein
MSTSDELDDGATASLLEGYIDAAEKRAWFLREAAQPHWSSTDALSRKSKTREAATCRVRNSSFTMMLCYAAYG